MSLFYHHDEIRIATRMLSGDGNVYTRSDLFVRIHRFYPDIPSNQFYPSYHCSNLPHPNSTYNHCACEGTCEGSEHEQAIFEYLGRNQYKVR